MKIVLLDSFAADQGEPAWDALASLGALEIHPRTAPHEVPVRAAGAAALITNKVVLGRAALDALPELRYIGVSATGVNVVDIAAARDRGIAVTNVPGYSTDAVAQLVFAFLLRFFVDVDTHDRAVKQGRWAAGPDFCFFLRPLRELAGKTMVIVGFGAIGRAVARIAEAFGMRVIAAAVPGSTAINRTPLARALAQADVVTLHAPLTPETEGLVDDTFLSQMRPGALLVNTSRGGLVDEAALARALIDGRLGGAAIDVLGREPPSSAHPLLTAQSPWADRLLVTPHLAWGTVEARARLRAEVAANLAAFARGERRNRVD